MSALTEAGLFHLEYTVRAEAERIRFRNPEADLFDRSISAVVKAHIASERKRADDFDMIGNLLAGLQADWTKLGPEVRAGYLRLRRENEALKTQGQPIAEDAA